jgi:phosphoglycerate dehydrogenase-like enzyme
MKIVFIEPILIRNNDARALEIKYAQQGHELIIYPDRNENFEVLAERGKDAEILVISNIPVSAELMSKWGNLKYLIAAFSGTDHIDMDYCKSRGIQISNAAGYSNESVAELSVGLCLSLLRNIPAADQQTRELKGRNGLTGTEISGKTVGIIGTGQIGAVAAKIFSAFNCTVLGYNRHRANGKYWEYAELSDIIRKADIISLYVPLNKGTKYMFGEKEFKEMKSSAILINCARGLVTDMHALSIALKQNEIAGAAFDIYETEPPLPENHPLLEAPNCLLMPHIAYATNEAMQKRIDIVFENIDSYLSGNVLRKV